MPAQAITNRQGRFVIERVPAGAYHVDVQKGASSLSQISPKPPKITVAAGQSLRSRRGCHR